MRLGWISIALYAAACGHSVTNPYEDADARERARFRRVRVPLPSNTDTRVRQGAFGASSHNEPGNQYSWDFEVPLGTPVLAAEGGVVIDVWSPAGGGGCDPRYADNAHNVKVRHDDGTVAQYIHVSTSVRIGQRVQASEAIARTASNGWICYPHLHFGVYASEAELYASPRRRTLPLLFEGLAGGIARQGARYRVR